MVAGRAVDVDLDDRVVRYRGPDDVLGRIEMAAAVSNPIRRRAALTFLVVGASYAGVELAAQMSRLTAALLPQHPQLRPTDVRWVLVDVADAVMPELGPHLGKDALALLKRRGVDVRLGVSVQEVTDTHAVLSDNTRLDCSTVIWCAGAPALPANPAAHHATGHRGRQEHRGQPRQRHPEGLPSSRPRPGRRRRFRCIGAAEWLTGWQAA